MFHIEANKEILYSLFASVVSAIVNFYIVSSLIDHLGVDQYANYAFIWVTITTLGNIVGLSTGAFLTTYLAEGLSINVAKISKTLIASSYVLVFLIVLVIAFVIFRVTVDDGILFVCVFSLLFCALDSALKGVLVGLNKMSVFFQCVIFGLFINVVLLELFKDSLSVSLALTFYLFAEIMLVSFVVYRMRYFLKDLTHRMIALENTSAKNLYGPYFLNTAAASLFPLALLVTYQLLNVYFDPAATTKFNVSYQFFTLISFVPVVVNRVLVPIIISKSNDDQIIYVLKVSTVNLIVGIGAFLFLYILADSIFIKLDMTIQYKNNLNYMMSLAAIVAVVAAPFGQYFMSHLEVKKGFLVNLGVSLTLVLSLWFFSTKSSLIGIGISFVLAYVVNLIIVSIIIKTK